VNKGRLIAIGLAAFALICGVVSLDYARGRVPETSSQLILDVLASGVAKQCRRDATQAVQKHILPGMARADVLRVIDQVTIILPSPWFWKASVTQSLSDMPELVRATRTLRATAFGNELLLLDIIMKDGKVESMKARVECAFG
jgi:hypothetical protein